MGKTLKLLTKFPKFQVKQQSKQCAMVCSNVVPLAVVMAVAGRRSGQAQWLAIHSNPVSLSHASLSSCTLAFSVFFETENHCWVMDVLRPLRVMDRF